MKIFPDVSLFVPFSLSHTHALCVPLFCFVGVSPSLDSLVHGISSSNNIVSPSTCAIFLPMLSMSSHVLSSHRLSRYYNAIFTPFFIAFLHRQDIENEAASFSVALETLVDVLFVMDIILSFQSGYFEV